MGKKWKIKKSSPHYEKSISYFDNKLRENGEIVN